MPLENSVPASTPAASTVLHETDAQTAKIGIKAQGHLLGQAGSLKVRLTCREAERHAAQRLRYDVFYAEMGAYGAPSCRLQGRDFDVHDAMCDHLIVCDSTQSEDFGIIATCRLIRQETAVAGFYSSAEYQLHQLLDRHPGERFLELGRSCIAASHRNTKTMELLWHGIWRYVVEHGVTVMFGCASFPGTDMDQHALSLSFLHHFATTGPDWAVSPAPGRGHSTNRLARSAIEPRKAIRELPPLIKGYLRLGARFADHAVIDPGFNTTDVMIVLPVADLNQRYVAHYGVTAERYR